jgi:hypothetical protein
MSEDLGKREPVDTSIININEDSATIYWTTKFGCTREQLKQAVRLVGTDPTAVAARLVKKSSAGGELDASSRR